ncbi:MAG: tetratricopeptide repeat protein [Bacteroidetes bacterium]|nr:tetratricopeptide repeat protein [Bacteroidota bacterium]
MLKHYLLITLLSCGVFFSVSAQTATSKTVTPVYSGPSANGDMKRDKGDFAGAVKDYTTEITKIDADAQRICKLKSDYEKMSEFDKMNANQDEVKKNYPDWAKLYFGRAMANISLGKKADAKPDLDVAIGLDGTMSDAYYQRALITNTKDNKDQACEDMSKAASLGNEKARTAFTDNFCWNSAMQHYKEGCSDVTLHKFDEAIAQLDIAIALCPDSGAYYSKRGQAYLGLNNKNKALADFTKATEASPNNADGFYQMGLYYFNQDDFDHAFEYLTKAINISPSNYDAFMARAQCCERTNKMTSAIYDYGQAISLRTSDPEAYYRRGLIERDMQNMQDACKDFRKASALGNTDATAFISECK